MRKGLVLAAVGGALIAGLALAPPAEASHGWSFGAGFHVGDAHFRIGFGPGSRGYAPAPFFYTTHRLGYRGHSCHGACFRRGRGFYHHAACPLVGFHFRRAGHHVGWFVDQYAPWGPGYRGGYGYRGYYDPHGYRRYQGRYRQHRYGPYRDAPRYRQHGYWERYRDRGHDSDWDSDSDSDSDSDRRHRRHRRHRHRY